MFSIGDPFALNPGVAGQAAIRQRVLANIEASRASRLAGPSIDEVAALKSIRRHSERLVRGQATSTSPAVNRQVRAINRHINIYRTGGSGRRLAWAGTRFHSLNFRFVSDAQARGFFQNLNRDARIAIPPGGFRAGRRPDYLFDPGEIYDIKPFRPSANAYDRTEQFLDGQRATGQTPIPLYYRLW